MKPTGRYTNVRQACARGRQPRLALAPSNAGKCGGPNGPRFPVVPFYPFLGKGSPANYRLQKQGYPYSNLSTGGPSLVPLENHYSSK